MSNDGLDDLHKQFITIVQKIFITTFMTIFLKHKLFVKRKHNVFNNGKHVQPHISQAQRLLLDRCGASRYLAQGH